MRALVNFFKMICILAFVSLHFAKADAFDAFTEAEDLTNLYYEMPLEEKRQALTLLVEELENASDYSLATGALVLRRNSFLQKQNIPEANRRAMLDVATYRDDLANTTNRHVTQIVSDAQRNSVFDADFHLIDEIDEQMQGRRSVNISHIREAFEHDMKLIQTYRREYLIRLGFDIDEVNEILHSDYSLLPKDKSPLTEVDKQIAGRKAISQRDIERSVSTYRDAVKIDENLRARNRPQIPRESRRPVEVVEANETRPKRFRRTIKVAKVATVIVVATVVTSYGVLGFSETNERLGNIITGEGAVERLFYTADWLLDLIRAISADIASISEALQQQNQRPGF